VDAIGIVNGMKEKRTGRSSVESVQQGADWGRLRSQNDSQTRRAIESDPEARATDAAFWKGARVVIRAAKQISRR
jgi:hypothetical protein